MTKAELILILQSDELPMETPIGFSPNHPNNEKIDVYSISAVGEYSVDGKPMLILQDDDGFDFKEKLKPIE